jgi:hypothetical protein
LPRLNIKASLRYGFHHLFWNNVFAFCTVGSASRKGVTARTQLAQLMEVLNFKVDIGARFEPPRQLSSFSGG